MKKRHLQRPHMQEYRNRDYRVSLLDDRHFDAMNQGLEGDFLYVTGCLDALDNIPAGSMVAVSDAEHDWMHHGLYDQSFAVRGLTLAELQEREEFMRQIVEEILAKEKRNV